MLSSFLSTIFPKLILIVIIILKHNFPEIGDLVPFVGHLLRSCRCHDQKLENGALLRGEAPRDVAVWERGRSVLPQHPRPPRATLCEQWGPSKIDCHISKNSDTRSNFSQQASWVAEKTAEKAPSATLWIMDEASMCSHHEIAMCCMTLRLDAGVLYGGGESTPGLLGVDQPASNGQPLALPPPLDATTEQGDAPQRTMIQRPQGASGGTSRCCGRWRNS